MTNRSTFPTTIDQFTELSEVIASDSTNISRYQTLLMQATRTSAEETEFQNLKTTLATKIVSSEHFNYLQDCISNLEDYFLNTVMSDISKTDVGVIRNDVGYPSNLITEDKTTLVNAINELHNDKASIESELTAHTQSTDNPHEVTTSQVNILTAYSDGNTSGSSYPIGITVSNVGTGTSNYPLSNGTLLSSKTDSSKMFQLFFDTGADSSHKSQPYYRFWFSGVGWSSWYQFETTSGSTTKFNASVQHTQGTKQMMLQKNTTGTLSVPANNYAGINITFDTAFVETPAVTGALNSSDNLAQCGFKIESVTTTGCKAWIYNNSNYSVSAIVSLMIYGTKSL